MKRRIGATWALVAALAVAGCHAGDLPGGVAGGGPAGRAAVAVPRWLVTRSARAACRGSRVGQAQCDALVENVRTDPNAVSGWTSAQLQTAYDLPSMRIGAGQRVFIVDAYDNPHVAHDLAVYRAAMGLPKVRFHKYNQRGERGNYPPANVGWGVEIDLDVEMVSASCPQCEIDLVEAKAPNFRNIGRAETRAVKLGATIVSNSFSGTGGNELDFSRPGVAYLASAGDFGYNLIEPATFADVISVGGTVLAKARHMPRGYREVVWRDSGGGCSTTDEPKPSWQTDPDCPYRTGNDVSAVAHGVAEYDSYGYRGWIVADGTSISSPLTAGIVALAGNATKQTGGENFWRMLKRRRRRELYDITSGNDGTCNPAGSYLCTAGTHQFGRFAGPTGWGTPHGIAAY